MFQQYSDWQWIRNYFLLLFVVFWLNTELFYVTLCSFLTLYLFYSVLIGGACTSIVFVVINLTFSDSKDFHSTYLPSIIFSLINVVIPKIITMVRWTLILHTLDVCEILRIPSERKMCFPQHEQSQHQRWHNWK